VGNLPLALGQLRETGANTGYDLDRHRARWKVFRLGMGPRPISLLVGSQPTKATTGSRPERATGHTGTETRPRLLREAAVGNIAQWAKA